VALIACVGMPPALNKPASRLVPVTNPDALPSLVEFGENRITALLNDRLTESLLKMDRFLRFLSARRSAERCATEEQRETSYRLSAKKARRDGGLSLSPQLRRPTRRPRE
jgi:hypothetical protein